MPSGATAARWSRQSSARRSTAASRLGASGEQVALLGAAHRADDAGTGPLGELSGEGADRADRRGNQDGVAHRRPQDVVHADPRREAGHAQGAQPGFEGDPGFGVTSSPQRAGRGPFLTDMLGHVAADQGVETELLALVPLGRYGLAADIVGAVRFLASRAGAYVTAAVIPLDGGITGCSG
ncbi:hypothetical protein ADL28_35020 [Streptomyces violaceusniger]|uniref:SDR family oxidoreductase n=3 Tax=Streptomyces violaceusniger group TaxID=2839105 RepID=A0ABD5JCT3_9ACTN|nr:SDR family oxidoreductase [Streptomyces violaceusniger]KUL46442.1 hypothetical protein ADL28_35020 [Streptomyces violaceusniger]MEE4586196.1 SDR family oxidoreductase [Streptomyces sp. DSM 41602]